MSTQPIVLPPTDSMTAQTEAECQTAESLHTALRRLRDNMEKNAHDTETTEQLLQLLRLRKRELVTEANQRLGSETLRDTVLELKQTDLEHLEDRDGAVHAERAAPLEKLVQTMKKCRKEERRILAFALRKRWLWWVEQ